MLRSDITGILLAGGKSSRMGQEKGLVEFRGKPLIQYGLELLSSFTDQIIIGSANPDYLQFGRKLVPDRVTGKGPAAGLAALLKSTATPWSIVLACDLPFLEKELIEELLLSAHNAQALVPIHGGIIEPLAALYRRDLAPTFEEAVAKGNLALHKILLSCSTNYLDVDPLIEKYPNLFVNLNSMDQMNNFIAG
jgi:molybdopterin-guanine dinucleotide biosynthesis protein A